MNHITKNALTFSLISSLLVGCSNGESNNQTSTETNSGSSSSSSTSTPASDVKFKIIASTFPEYDWTRELLGDLTKDVELIQLIDNGVDLHSFSPTVDDIVKISECDLFIHTGGTSDAWVDDVLAQSLNPDLIVINLLEALGSEVKITEFTEGMEEHDHDHDHDDHDHDDHDDHDHDDHDHDHDDHDDHDHDDHDHDDHDEDEHDHDEDEHDHDHDDHDHDDHDEDEDEHDHDHDEDEHDHDHDEEEHDHDHDEEEHDHDHDEEEHDHDHDEEDHDHDHDDHDEEMDEHVWLSINNATKLCQTLANALTQLDPDSSDIYAENLENYLSKLDDLDQQYTTTLSAVSVDTIVVADRFPFRYLVDDYNINYYAAFSGCSADAEASFDTIVFLAEKVNELNLNYVVTTETGHKIATTVVDSTTEQDQEIVALNSMQSTTSKDNTSYLQMMEENLTVLEKILK